MSGHRGSSGNQWNMMEQVDDSGSAVGTDGHAWSKWYRVETSVQVVTVVIERSKW